jgi:DNA-binding NtrC family response regulator
MLTQIARVMAGHYRVISHTNPSRAMALLETDERIEIFVTEQVMRFGNGIDLLESARSMRPSVRRVMITNYADLASIIPGVHSGAIQSLAQKPASDDELRAAIAPQLTAQLNATLRRKSA